LSRSCLGPHSPPSLRAHQRAGQRPTPLRTWPETPYGANVTGMRESDDEDSVELVIARRALAAPRPRSALRTTLQPPRLRRGPPAITNSALSSSTESLIPVTFTPYEVSGNVRSGVGRSPALDELSEMPVARFKTAPDQNRSVELSLVSQPFSPTQPRFTAVQSNSAAFHSRSV
jgi:hypothetical protein